MSELFEYKCPSCGGTLKFNAGTQSLKCPYCGSEINVEALEEQDKELGVKEDSFNWEDLAGAEWDEGETEGMKVYACNSCGGEIIADESTGATRCPYCDNPVVMKGNFEGDLKPDLVIPFKISKERAKEAYYNHLKGKMFLPKEFKDENHIDEMKAIYVPFWLYDCDADASIEYNATRMTAWSDGDYNYTRTDYYKLYREGSISFENVPVDGSLAMPDDLTQSVEPYNMDEAVPFRAAYLAGYLADRYTVDVKQSLPIANQRIKTSMEDEFRRTTMGYASVLPGRSYIEVNRGRSRYAMLPIWVLNTTYKGERFIFSINGQTGKTAGNLPLDKSAARKYMFKISAIATVIIAAAELALMMF